ncbi:MAG: MoaD/ThiS family protein [Saprospiraceae bacterium]|jgi:molybdopterin synthase sulfur carrier subunit|nr:MoaD/ThiS family protein [Saprospiraceae bacterium]
MKISLLSFGIAKDITGQRFLDVELPSPATVGDLRSVLVKQFPRLSELASVRLAVNSEYADESVFLSENDEVALIPPVSGG